MAEVPEISDRPLILLVEDDPLNAVVTQKRLERAGYSVEWVAEAETAVTRIAHSPTVGLVLMDIDLGAGMNGVEAARVILNQVELPIVFVSGRSEAQLAQEVSDIAHYGFMTKEGERENVIAAVVMAWRFWKEHQQRRQAERMLQQQTQTAMSVARQRDETESRYRLLAENTSDALWSRNLANNSWELVSPASEKILGYAPSELMALPPDQLYPPAARAKIARQLARRIEHFVNNPLTAKEYTDEIKLVKKDGQRIWAEIVYRFSLAEQGGLRMMGVTRDITQRKLAQLALERSREQFELAVRGMNDGIWDWDIRTNSLYLSPLWKQMVGYQEDELPNEMATFESRIHPEDYNRVMSYLQTYLAGELSEYRIEFRFRHRKGHYVWILARGEALRDRSGRPYRMAGSHSDITESKEMLQKLEHSERRFREIAETLPEMLYEALLDGRLIYVNPRAFELTGYCPEDIEAGLNVIDLVVPRDRGKARHTMQRVLSGERSGLRQYSLIRKDGSELPVLIHSIPVLREDQVIGLRGFLVDISERVVMENQMRQMEKMNAIGQLAGGIAHDFNNQIAGVMGYCQMLRKRLEDPVQQTLLDKILSSALRSADLTRKLLAFSHQGQQEITRVDLNALIHEVVDVLKHCIDRRIEFTLLLASEPLYVEGDYTQLQNALLNLGLNARDAMPSGGEIRVESAQVVLDQEASRRIDLALDPGEYVRVVVADTGCGMSESVKERIFEPFFTTKKVGEGSGMGLPAVYGTVKHHRGAISVSSKEGEGAVFTLWFPAGCHEISNSGISQTHEASDAFCDRLLGKKLLLIDDEQIVCEIAQEAFESVGAEVEVFEDAVLAVEYFRNHHLSVDLVMLDLNMPRLDGEQVLAYLTEINPGVPILIVSGTRLTGKLLAMHEQGELGYLSKPFELDRLIHTASAVLQGHAEGQDDQG